MIRTATPTKFSHYLGKLQSIKRKDSTNILLINAWNEWGEGAILEPTMLNRYGYLEVIKKYASKGI